MSLMLCDDHAMFADALAKALQARGHTIVGITDNPDSAIEIVVSESPDLCLMDVEFVGACGLDASARIREISPGTKIVLLTGAVSDDVWQAYESRLVDGVVRKTCDIAIVDRVISQVTDGQRVVEGWKRTRATPSREQRLVTELTARERAVLDLIVAGESTQTIARSLGVAESTVRTHVQAVLRKLGVNGRLKAARILVSATGSETGPVHHRLPQARSQR